MLSAATKSTKGKTYYDTLGLNNDCSQKEIRNAFITLSKKYHPDVKTPALDSLKMTPAQLKNESEDFVRVLEAYKVLSRGHSRENYDLSLKGINTVHFVNRDIFYEPWKSGGSSRTADHGPYYGIKGLNRVANWKIVVACIVFCSIGILVQVLAVNKSLTLKREELEKASIEYSKNHAKTRFEALKNGNADQLERIKSRLRKSNWENEE